MLAKIWRNRDIFMVHRLLRFMLHPLKRNLLGRSGRYSYRGVLMQKNPVDLSIYLKLLWDLKPKTIIEVGSQAGGSAMWFSDQMKAMDLYVHVYSIDLKPPKLQWNNVTFLGTDGNLNFNVCPKPWLVIEDSAHDYKTTIGFLEFFDSHLCDGDYVVVEDIHVPAVSKAVTDWLSRGTARYRIDRHYQDYWGFSDHCYMRVHRSAAISSLPTL